MILFMISYYKPEVKYQIARAMGLSLCVDSILGYLGMVKFQLARLQPIDYTLVHLLIVFYALCSVTT